MTTLIATLLFLMVSAIVGHLYLAPIAQKRRARMEAERRAKRDNELAALRAQRPKVGMEVG